MKLFLKRSFIVFLCLLLVFGNFFVGQKRVEAFWAGVLPAGITVGGGLYALGALAVGSVATGIGLEYGDEIYEHAGKVWNDTTDLAKSTLEASMQLVTDTGEAIANIGTGFWDWVTDKADKIASAVTIGGKVLDNMEKSKAHQQEIETEAKFLEGDEIVVKPVTITTAYPNVIVNVTTTNPPSGTSFLGTYRATFTFPEGSSDAFAFTSNSTGLIQFRELIVAFSNGAITINGYDRATDLGSNSYNIYTNLASEMRKTNAWTTDQTPWIVNNVSDANGIFYTLLGSHSVENILGNLGTLGIDIGVGSAETWESYNNTRQKLLTQDIPQMKDAGLVLPVNDILPHVAGNPSNTLEYDADAGAFIGVDGQVYTGEVGWAIPNVRVVTGVDGLPYTVYRTADGTYIDVRTGEGVTVQNPTNPPVEGGPEKDWKARMKGLVTTKFPFSLPWDFYTLLAFLNTDPVTPEFKIDTTFMGEPIKFEANLDSIDKYVPFFRAFIVIGFCISLVMGTRRLLGGSV